MSTYHIEQMKQNAADAIEAYEQFEKMPERLRHVLFGELSILATKRYRIQEDWRRASEAVRLATERLQQKKTILEGVLPHLPKEWGAEILSDNFGDIWIKTNTRSIQLKRSNQFRKDSYVLVVDPLHSQTRRFPRKADGSFNIEKIITVIEEDAQASRVRELRLATEKQREDEFKRLLTPYCEYGPYGVSHELTIDDSTRLRVLSQNDGTYYVQTISGTTMSAERLEAHLEQVAKKIVRKQGVMAYRG